MNDLKDLFFWNKYKIIDNRVAEITDAHAKNIYKRIAWFKLWRSSKIYLLDFSCFGKIHRLIAAGLSKQKSLDADPRAIQQIIFTGKTKSTVANTRVII